MTTFALVHPDHGTHFVYSKDEVAAHEKLGWKIRPENWKELRQEEVRLKQIAARKADQERIAEELAELEKPKRKYTRKAA